MDVNTIIHKKCVLLSIVIVVFETQCAEVRSQNN